MTMSKKRVQIKQTVVRWVSCEIDTDDEELARELLFDTVQEDGWDGEDVLEESYSMEEKDNE